MIFPVFALTKNLDNAEKYAWNPVTVMIGAVHGQFDSITLFFLLAALYFSVSRKNTHSAGLSFAAAFQSKWWPVMLAPAFLLRLKLKDIIIFCASWLALFLIFSSPYLGPHPGLMLKPFHYLGVNRDYGITGVIYYLTNHLFHANPNVFRWSVIAVMLFCFIAVGWSLYAARKWELGASVFFTLLTFYIFCPGWSVQYYAWPAVLMFLFGLHKSRLYAAFTAIVFLIYFSVVAFDFAKLAGLCDCDFRNVLALASMFIILYAGVPLWRKIHKNNGNINQAPQ